MNQITEDLKASEEKFRMIFENAQDMISFVDLEGKILDINPAVETLFGVKPEYAIGKHFSDYEVVVDYGDKEISEILADTKMVRNQRKIKACIDNARVLRDIVKDHGSVQKYIESFAPSDSFENLMLLKVLMKGAIKIHGCCEITSKWFFHYDP